MIKELGWCFHQRMLKEIYWLCDSCLLDENGEGDIPDCLYCYYPEHLCLMTTAEACKRRYKFIVNNLKRGNDEYDNMIARMFEKVVC